MGDRGRGGNKYIDYQFQLAVPTYKVPNILVVMLLRWVALLVHRLNAIVRRFLSKPIND